jgi:hypothetical protein
MWLEVGRMKALEAKLVAQKRAKEIEEERAVAEARRQKAAAQEWQSQRAAWLKNHIAWIEQLIADAVYAGKEQTDAWLASFEKREHAEQKVFRASFAFEPELKKVIAHFTKLGYKLKFEVKAQENVDFGDVNPRDSWTTYQTILEISW